MASALAPLTAVWWQVPHGNRGSICRVSHTQDGMYLCVGNGQGDTYVYDALDGSLVTHLRPRKVCVLRSECSDTLNPKTWYSICLPILGAHPARAVHVQGSISSTGQCRRLRNPQIGLCLLCQAVSKAAAWVSLL